MDRIDTPTTPAAPTTGTLLAATALALADQPAGYLAPLDITRAVLHVAPDVSIVGLRPVWEALPLTRGARPSTYVSLLFAVATDSDPDMDEALRRARAPRPAVAA